MDKTMLTMNPMEKNIMERNTTSDNVSFLIDNKNCLCQPEKMHPLTARNRGWISERMYIYLKNHSTRLT